MNAITTILILCNVLLPCVYAYRRCWSSQGIELNHTLAFTWGFVFYWITPIALGIWKVFPEDNNLATQVWYALFRDIAAAKVISYFSITLGVYLAFMAGTALAERRGAASLTGPRKCPRSVEGMKVYFSLALLFFVIACMGARGDFFKGYTNIETVEDLNGRGTFAAATAFSSALWILYSSIRHQKLARCTSASRIFANRFLILYVCAAALGVTMGERYPVITVLFIYGTYRSVYIQRWKPIMAGTCSLLILSFAFIAGAFRTGLSGPRQIGDILFKGLSETLNGSLSLVLFLREYTFGVIRVPVALLNDVVYLIPRFLLPQKDSLLITPEALGFTVFSPVGGLNSFFSCMVNFGAVGTAIVVFALGFYLGRLKAKRHSILSRAIYSMLSGCLFITLFRNPFEVSVIKDSCEMSVLVPAFVLWTLYLFSPSQGSDESIQEDTSIRFQGIPQ